MANNNVVITNTLLQQLTEPESPMGGYIGVGQSLEADSYIKVPRDDANLQNRAVTYGEYLGAWELEYSTSWICFPQNLIEACDITGKTPEQCLIASDIFPEVVVIKPEVTIENISNYDLSIDLYENDNLILESSSGTEGVNLPAHSSKNINMSSTGTLKIGSCAAVWKDSQDPSTEESAYWIGGNSSESKYNANLKLEVNGQTLLDGKGGYSKQISTARDTIKITVKDVSSKPKPPIVIEKSKMTFNIQWEGGRLPGGNMPENEIQRIQLKWSNYSLPTLNFPSFSAGFIRPGQTLSTATLEYPQNITEGNFTFSFVLPATAGIYGNPVATLRYGPAYDMKTVSSTYYDRNTGEFTFNNNYLYLGNGKEILLMIGQGLTI